MDTDDTQTMIDTISMSTATCIMPQEEDSIGMVMAKDTVANSAKKIQVQIFNNSRNELFTDEYFKIEYYTPNGWIECKRKHGVVINDIGIGIRPTGKYTFDIPIWHLILESKYKKYRVLKTVRIGSTERILDCVFYIE